ncbi:hypothetical protein A11A3_00040 [Alcanivorax hongdengensis A-11-3]|uniref:LamG-like jellyroll fold domain-containing protein n=1 Tax=Alcanivorax hongdengensis A-11-3 TaxID=1177179 RepID=L0WFN2_9GAMM|nr:LamG domain-containing protein [Alcanivorax hongdengensis]EKF75836.1 hypothetical protein A11A3_00040 [Alcanivorax hongdengensis A-11-3]
MIKRTLFIPALFALALTGCGGSDSGAATVSNRPDNNGDQAVTYSGPAPKTNDVSAFKINLWNNLVSEQRCGGCHRQQTPAFVQTGDINDAYSAANPLVDLERPTASRMVQKVAGGHNCWETDPQVCADLISTWISAWAGQSLSGGGGTTELQTPPIKDAGSSKNFPADPSLFESTVYPVLDAFCSDCHQRDADTPQSPYFASDDVSEAYTAAQSKIDMNSPALSRLVERLAEDNHNCWTDDCAHDAQVMEDKITEMANGISATAPDAALVLSKALQIDDGTLAAGGGRYDNNVIARYEFRTGEGLTAYDTSGVDPAINLQLSGDVAWEGGWGIRINDGKAQGSTATSQKLRQLITATGEYTLEAWLVPASTGQSDANIVSYSAGTTARNLTLAQDGANYALFQRIDGVDDANGEPALETSDDGLQASLQHVVATYDAVNGRRLYINGQFTGDLDPSSPGLLNNWDDTFALVLGNEASGDRPWQGVIRFLAIHNRALSAEQIQTNFDAGVGERYYLPFYIGDLINQDGAYIVFEVSRFDNYSYLFNAPYFINLKQDTISQQVAMKGLRLGINGKVPQVAQSYARLNTQLGGDGYSEQGQTLSRLGTLLPVEQEGNDEFFLSFDQLGSHSHVYTEPQPLPLQPATYGQQPLEGLRTFAEINATMSRLTGVPESYGDVPGTYSTLRAQLPSEENMEAFLTAQQVGVAQLAIEYCNALVEAERTGDSRVTPLFTDMNYSQSVETLSQQQWRDRVISPLYERMVGNGQAHQPNRTDVEGELEHLLFDTNLTQCSAGDCVERTATATKAACAAMLGSATMLFQ